MTFTDGDATPRNPRRTGRLIAGVALSGITITAAASLAAWSVDRRNEARLLRVQTRQAAALISAEVVNITSPLTTALHVASATDGRGPEFAAYLSTVIGAGELFVDGSLWRTDGPVPTLVTALGVAPEDVSSSAPIDQLVQQTARSDGFTVSGLPADGMTRVAYAMADASAPGWVVLAERAIPANRRVPLENGSAFSNLHFVTYLGNSTRSEDVATTDVAPSDLPLRGVTDRTTIPFGNTVITLVTSRDGRLGGNLGAALPWIFGAVGTAMTIAIAFGAARFARRRRIAEQDAATITHLYAQLDQRYGEQRRIAETLQRALLPPRNPVIEGLEIACRYVAGGQGIDVGGDWYSIMPVTGTCFAFVVGDVSGRGLTAATVMARLRFTLRAYLLEGHLPDQALQMCGRQLDMVEDEHFATVLVGVADTTTRELTIANAGHLQPLVVTDAGADYVVTHVGLPLGVAAAADYPTTRFTMPADSTLLAFTDGLVERRGEDLVRGLDRLAAAARVRARSLEESLAGILRTLNHDGPEDDIAILAFRWASAEEDSTPAG
jgi:serine phosphatase RsbU (regulator of sigma subunit)